MFCEMKYSLKQLIGRTYNNSKDYKRGIPINGSKTVSLIKKKKNKRPHNTLTGNKEFQQHSTTFQGFFPCPKDV